jgi:hypothetical protein
MPAYYFDMEGIKSGEKADPATDMLITIAYQKMELTTGEPLGELKILREWESSEKEIVTSFYHEFFRPEVPFTRFIPVGMGLEYEYEMLMAKAAQYNLPAITSHELYYRRPRFDMKAIIILLNDGRFNGARLDTFSAKKSDVGLIKGWYEKKDFRKIERCLRDEADGFSRLLQYLNKNKDLMGVTKKGESAFRQLPQEIPPDSKKGYTVHQKGPSREMPAAKKDTPRKSYGHAAPVSKSDGGSRKSPARVTKAKSALKAPETPTSKRLAGAASQFRKHTPSRK